MQQDEQTVKASLSVMEWQDIRRKRLGLTKEEIGRRINLSGSYVTRVFNEQVQDPDTRERIMEVLRQEEKAQAKAEAETLRQRLAEVEKAAA